MTAPTNVVSKALRLGRTLRYVPLEAIKWRLLARAKRFYYASPLYGLQDLMPDDAGEPHWVGVELFGGDPAAGTAMAKGQFTFAGITLPLATGADGSLRTWLPTQASALWVFHLHYHEWLADLRAAGQRAVARQLVADWLLSFGRYHPVAWHPYPTSLRVVAWLTHGHWLLDGADDDLRQAFYACLYRQAAYVMANPELDLGGNHLLKNLKAMIYGGLALEQADMYAQGMAGLLRQLPVQILPDGMHYELSPLYAAQVLRDLLEIRAVLRNAGGAPKPVEEAVRKLGTALGMFVHGDGGLALFNDADVLDAPYVAQLLRQSGADDAPEILPDAGYARLSRGGMSAWFDAGKVGPDENPGHAHADMLSFELDIGRERVVVNGGTYAYQHALRNTFRATASHSTVSLEGVDSAEVWGGFRVGRRPREVELVLQGGAEPLPGGDIWVEGSHDGYAYVGAQHRRKLVMAADGSRMRGEDEITFRKPSRRVRAHFHIHPDVNVRLVSDSEAELETAAGVRIAVKVDGGRLDVRDSRYAPHFGVMKPCRQLLVHGRAQGGVCRLGWAFERIG
ncbi:MAG: hypothetical protein DI628_08110 [Blastochloris viridis]|uniref:Uncharacterized protein n=1 Tax=Blastochloris viridis TaxID=1079 RepID=A0A6N4R5K9_BLAVI|nr:MAG: hypothetical protein DI628_08110 [Blastochloris viridis]